MQVCTSLQADNHASTPPLSFFTGRMPFLPPNHVTALKAHFPQSSGKKGNNAHRQYSTVDSHAPSSFGALITLTEKTKGHPTGIKTYSDYP